MKGIGRFLALSFCACAAMGPASAAPRLVEVEGVAPAGGDPSAARRAAMGDALRQALAMGGMDIEAETLVDRNVIAADRFRATARGHVTDYRLVDEWRDGGLLHVSVAVTLDDLEARPACSARDLPPLHLGATRADVDSAIDPGVSAPLLAGFEHAMRIAFGADPSDALAGPAPQPVSISWRSSDRYAALAYGRTPASGLYVRPYIRLARREVRGLALVRGQRLEAVFGIELIDAARGTLLGRVDRRQNWTLASRAYEYLSAEYRPARRAVPPDAAGLFAALADEARAFIRCHPVVVEVQGRLGDELLLGGGADSGLHVGDLVGPGGDPGNAGGIDWPIAEVVSVTPSTARARLMGTTSGTFGNTVVRLR